MMRHIAIDTEYGLDSRPFIVTMVDDQLQGKLYYSLEYEEDYNAVKKICESRKIVKVFHSATSDMYALSNIDIHVPTDSELVEDTMIISSLVNENDERKNLKFMAKKYLNEACEESKLLSKMKAKYKREAKKAGKEFDYSMIPKEVIEPYALRDPEYTLKLFYLFKKPIQEFKELYLLEKQLIPITLKMVQRGMKIDRDFVKKSIKDFENRLSLLDKKIRYELTKMGKFKKSFVEEFNIKSSKQLLTVFDTLKLNIRKLTKKQQPSTDSESLKMLIEDYPKLKMVKYIEDFRFFTKQLTTYYRPFLNRYTTAEDWVGHFSLFQSGAKTGRFSCELAQTIPKVDKERKDIPSVRRAFVCRKNYVMVFIDYEQIEMRIFAHYAKAKQLIKDIINGFDAHAGTAAMIYGVPIDKVTKEQRSTAKTINFGICLTGDTVVVTEKGSKLLKDIQIGDKVLTHTGLFKKVLNTSKKYSSEIVEIVTNTGKILRATPEHMIMCHFPSANGYAPKVGFVPAGDLKIKDILVYHGTDYSSKMGNLKLDKNLVRMLGWYIAEGCDSHIKQSLTANKEIAEEMRFVLEKLGWKTYIETWDIGNGYRFKCPIGLMNKYEKLFDYDFYLRSSTQHIPNIVFELSSDLKKLFIGALWDGDGCVTYRTGVRGSQHLTISYVSKSWDLVCSLQKLLHEFGVNSIIDDNRKPEKPHVLRVLSSVGRRRFLDMIDSLKCRKAKIEYKPKKIFLVDDRVASTRKIAKKQLVYDILVEQDHTFIANNLVVHNCYGMGQNKLARSLGLSLKEARELLDKYYEGYPVQEFMQKNTSDLYKKGALKLSFNSSLMSFSREYKVPQEKAYKATNYLIQSCLDGKMRVYDKTKGYVHIEELAGQQVCVWDGEKYVNAFCMTSGVKQKVIVEFINGQKIVCSPVHLFKTISSAGTTVWQTPEQFYTEKNSKTTRTMVKLTDEVGFGLNLPLKLEKENIFDYQDLPDRFSNESFKKFVFETIKKRKIKKYMVAKLFGVSYGAFCRWFKVGTDKKLNITKSLDFSVFLDWLFKNKQPEKLQGRKGRKVWNTKELSLSKLSDFDFGVLLGRLGSDGIVSIRKDGGGSCTWLVAEHEKGILKYLRQKLKLIGDFSERVVVKPGYTKKGEPYKPIYYLSLHSRILAKQLAEVKEGVPKYLWSNKEALRGFLQGMFDGDGGVSDVGGGHGYISLCFGKKVDSQYGRDIQQALLLFGIRSRFREYKCSKRVNIFKRSVSDFLVKIGFLNMAKQAKGLNLKNSKNILGSYGKVERVRSVEFTNEYVPMYDIVNSDSGQFMVEGLITHNSAAYVMKMAMLRVSELIRINGWRCQLLLTVHDELIFEIHKSEPVMKIVKLLKETMEDWETFDIPITASAKMTETSWDQAKEIKFD